MDHRPYEEWLLNDERLNPEQDRDLRFHLRSCPHCNILAQANLSLRASAVIAPPAGFTKRFQSRLIVQQKVERRRMVIGLFLLATVATAALLWLLIPYWPYLTLPPQRIASIWISHLVSIFFTVRALSAFGSTLLNVLSSLVPAYVWLLVLLLSGGLGMLGMSFLRKAGKKAPLAA